MGKPASDAGLAEQITACQAKTKKPYRYRKVQIWLERQEVHCNPKTILRVMQKYGLLSEVRRGTSIILWDSSYTVIRIS